MYNIVYTKASTKDVIKLKAAHLNSKTKSLISIISINPYQTTPPYEKLTGDLNGLYFRRINNKHRLVYQIYESKKIIKIISLWTHYENL